MVIGKLWIKEKNGRKFFSGTIDVPFLGTLRFTVFRISYDNKKKSDADPDYEIVWNPRPKTTDSPEAHSDDVPF